MQTPFNNRIQRHLLAMMIALFVFCIFLQAETGPPPQLGTFPVIQATSLDGAKLRLPQNFSGRLNLVLIAFSREQQPEVDTWVPAARQTEAQHGEFHYYELAATSRNNFLYRWWFDAALRSNTPDNNMRGRTLTAYASRHSLRKMLHIANEKQVVALLVDREGKIYWRADGPLTEQAKTAIQAALTAQGM